MTSSPVGSRNTFPLRTNRTIALIATSGAALLALSALPPGAAIAETAPAVESAEAAARVAEYQRVHPTPTPPQMRDLSEPDVGAAELASAEAFGKAMHRYWRDFPWEAGAAQWGCEISDLILEYNEATPEWKIGFPSVQFGASCDDPSLMLTVHKITSLNTAALERVPAEAPGSETAEPSSAGEVGTASVVYPSCNSASTLKTGPVYTYSTNTLRSIGSTYAMSANWFLAFDQATSSGSVSGERSRICAG